MIFAEYLHEASKAWRDAEKDIGEPSNSLKWPVGEGMKRNNGVAAYVVSTEGAIGYVDLLHALANNISYGAVQNKDNLYIHAEPKNMTAAAKGLATKINDDLTFKLTNKSGKEAYPICGAVWAVCYQNQPAATQKMVADFLHWVTHEGQEFAEARTYAPLPDDLIERVDQKIKSIKTVQ